MTDVTDSPHIPRVLVVEDNIAQLTVLTDLVEAEGFLPVTCRSGQEALLEIEKTSLALAIIDDQLPDMRGTQLLNKLRTVNKGLRAIINTGYGSFESARDAVNYGAFAYVEKLNDPKELVQHIHRAYQDWMAEALHRSEERFAKVVHASPLGITIFTADEGRIREVNTRFLDILGLPRNRVFRKTLQELCLHTIEHLRKGWLAVALGEPQGHEREVKIVVDGTTKYLQSVFERVDWLGEPCYLWMAFDLTQRRKIEQEVQLLAEALRNTSECMSITDAAERILFVNDAFLKTYGYERHELIGQPIGIVRASANPPTLIPTIIAETLQHGSWQGELLHVRKDGSLFPVKLSTSVLRDEQDEVLCFIRASYDITAAKQAEQALRESEARYRLLAEHTVDLICLHEPDGHYLYISPSSQHLLGYTPEELHTLDPYDIIHWEDRARIRFEAHHMALKGIKIPRAVYRVQKKDGSFIWFETDIVPVFNAQNEVVQLVSSSRDITDRIRVEEAIRRSESRLREAQHMARVGSWDWDLLEDRLTWSDEMYHIHGLPMKALETQVETALTAMVHPDDQERVSAFLDRLLQHHGHLTQEYRIVRPDGVERIVYSKGEMLRNAEGKPYRMMGTVQDITTRRRLEEEILEISNREQRRIGQDLHDELGQLLTGIGFRVAALEGNLRKNAREAADEAAEIVHMVEQAVSETRALARGLNPLSVGQQGLASALRDFTRRIEKVHGISCTLSDISPYLILDQEVAMQVYRIVQEAVHNAIKHAQPSRIDVLLEHKEGVAILIVQDDGCGFKTSLPDTARGMGLRIMKFRASMIGGTFEIHPNKPQGTVISCRFVIPHAKEQHT